MTFWVVKSHLIILSTAVQCFGISRAVKLKDLLLNWISWFIFHLLSDTWSNTPTQTPHHFFFKPGYFRKTLTHFVIETKKSPNPQLLITTQFTVEFQNINGKLRGNFGIWGHNTNMRGYIFKAEIKFHQLFKFEWNYISKKRNHHMHIGKLWVSTLYSTWWQKQRLFLLTGNLNGPDKIIRGIN